MRRPQLFLLLLLLSVLGFARCDEEHYTSKYDSVDYRAILHSERLLKSYYNCLMDKGPCTAEGKELRNILPDALKTECSKCTEKQKAGAREVVDFIVKDKPDWFKDLQNKYDPDGIYKEKYKDKWLEMGYSID
ncbi:unnamed protein product [Phyllotreta striolata]|uniref:Uncharacterized protein n=1 Tax=Phyllotreta striolata TaxID=444603 RepID=A0A9N9TP69_PHYSR|nr:unnamed protein product [Phyllotreta striolata]